MRAMSSCNSTTGTQQMPARAYRPSVSMSQGLLIQTSYQYAFKWLRAEFEEGYTSFTDLIGVDSRYDVTPEWDVGGQLYGLHSWEAGTMDYAFGLSVGHSFAKNVWLSVGYNFAGFYDEDFAGARYTAQGAFLQFRVKFDQDSYKELKSLVAPPATPMPGR